MQDHLTNSSGVRAAQGKPKGEAPTQIEIAYRALRDLKDRLNEATGAHVLARLQSQAALDQVTPGANATVRRMADKSRGALIYLDAALEAATELDADLGNVAEAVRQAAIEDNQRRAAWGDMQAEVRAYAQDASSAIRGRQEYADRYVVWKGRAKRWAVYGVVGGTLLGAVSVILALAVYVASGGY